jgi:hypothetical protein
LAPAVHEAGQCGVHPLVQNKHDPPRFQRDCTVHEPADVLSELSLQVQASSLAPKASGAVSNLAMLAEHEHEKIHAVNLSHLMPQ